MSEQRGGQRGEEGCSCSAGCAPGQPKPGLAGGGVGIAAIRLFSAAF